MEQRQSVVQPVARCFPRPNEIPCGDDDRERQWAIQEGPSPQKLEDLDQSDLRWGVGGGPRLRSRWWGRRL